MPRNPLAAHPPWRQLLIIGTLVPVAIALAVLAFTWPAARTAPNDLPLGVVGSGPSSQQVALALNHADPGGFDLHIYASDAAARNAISHRDVYGAIEVTPSGLTLLTASAASPAAAQILYTVAIQTAAHVTPGQSPTIEDVVPTSPHDPKGAVLASTVLPLVLGGEILAVVIAALVGFRPAWRQTTALLLGAAVAGLGAYLVVQTYLGALPGNWFAIGAVLAGLVFTISTVTAGLFDLVGGVGIGTGAALMIFLGNPFSGVNSAPQLLPDPVDRIGQWLPPGAAGALLRDVAYFNGHGTTEPIIVLTAWGVAGLIAIVLGHRYTGRHKLHHFPHAVDRPDEPGDEGSAALTAHLRP